jgi:hypothetical protein
MGKVFGGILLLLFTSLPLMAASYHFVVEPKAGQCFPADPDNKKYLSEKETWLYVDRVFQCDYVCLDQDGQAHLVRGTSKERDWFDESGRSFVCEGYRETLRWIETPGNPHQWGYYDIDGITPFYPRNRNIPELKAWARSL